MNFKERWIFKYRLFTKKEKKFLKSIVVFSVMVFVSFGFLKITSQKNLIFHDLKEDNQVINVQTVKINDVIDLEKFDLESDDENIFLGWSTDKNERKIVDQIEIHGHTNLYAFWGVRTTKNEVVEEEIGFKTKRVHDNTIFVGEEVVKQEGKVGKKIKHLEQIFIDEKLVEVKVLKVEEKIKPQELIILVGTQKRPIARVKPETKPREIKESINNKNNIVQESKKNSGKKETVKEYKEIYGVPLIPNKDNDNFSNCKELRAVYEFGVPKGHPAYKDKHDRDKDGWACEVPGAPSKFLGNSKN